MNKLRNHMALETPLSYVSVRLCLPRLSSDELVWRLRVEPTRDNIGSGATFPGPRTYRRAPCYGWK
jgi:hypothetical protein